MPARSDSAAASMKVDRPEGRIATEVAGANTSRENPTVAAIVVPEDQAQSPSWNRVVSEGRRRNNLASGSNHRKPSTEFTHQKPQRKRTGIIHTGTASIQAVQTKMVSVFATRFDPSLEAGTLTNYLKGKLGREVECRKIEAAQGRFSSFQVTVECKEVAEMYGPHLWPTGSFVSAISESVAKEQAITELSQNIHEDRFL